MQAFYIILVAVLIAISTSLLGSFLILRRMAMMGDAISHAVLPGIVLAYLFSGDRDPLVMVLGAGITGVLTSFVVQFLHEKVKMQSDAAIGLVFTSFFALGIILITLYASKIDLDQECVLYGEIAYVPMDIWITSSGINMGVRSLYVNGITALLVVGFVMVYYRPLLLTSFDPFYARSIGISATLWHYVLMGAVSFVTVSSFESVGAILVVAFLVVPAATSYLLTKHLPAMLILSVCIGILNAVTGYYLALWANTSIAASMASMSGVLFCIGFVISLLRKRKRTSPNTQSTLIVQSA